MHAVFSMETCPTVRKIRPFTRFWWQTVRYIGPAGDISTLERYLHRILQAQWYARRFYRRIKPNCTKNATIYSILKKTKRYFAFVGDIPPFSRYFHRILHAECYARQFHRRNIKICARNATIYSILTKTVRYIRPVGDISTYKRYFYCILHAECYARRF